MRSPLSQLSEDGSIHSSELSVLGVGLSQAPDGRWIHEAVLFHLIMELPPTSASTAAMDRFVEKEKKQMLVISM